MNGPAEFSGAFTRKKPAETPPASELENLLNADS
jgi:hypothetical protein